MKLNPKSRQQTWFLLWCALLGLYPAFVRVADRRGNRQRQRSRRY